MSKVITFQVVDDGLLRKTVDPEFWRAYRVKVIREITQNAMATVQDRARALWAHPSGGGLDQSWFNRIDEARGVGTIWNGKPYAYYLNYGVMPHKMRYLLLNNRGAYYVTRVDPDTGMETQELQARVLITPHGGGEASIRTITERSINDNPSGPPWWHPGLPALEFLQNGLAYYRDFKLKKDFAGLTVRIFSSGGL